MVDLAAPPRALTPLSRSRQRLGVLLPSVAFFMVTLDALVVVTALPTVRRELGGDPAGLQWIVNAYNLTFAAGIVTAAALGDRYGRRRTFLVGLAVFTVSSAACALAPTLALLIAFRAVQGLGAAVLAPVGLTLVTTAIPVERRGAAVGLWGGISGLGVAAGPLIGGAVTEGLDWHWVFWVNVPIGIVTFAGCALVLPESRGPRRALDVPGMVLAAGSLCALVAALVDAPSKGWSGAHTLGLLAVAAGALAGFVVRERRAAAPMIPLGLFRSWTFSAAALANLLSAAAIFSAAFVMSAWFQVGLGYGPLATGLRFLPWTLTPLFVAPLAGTLSDRLGPRRVAVPGLLLQAAGFIWIVLLAGSARPSSRSSRRSWSRVSASRSHSRRSRPRHSVTCRQLARAGRRSREHDPAGGIRRRRGRHHGGVRRPGQLRNCGRRDDGVPGGALRRRAHLRSGRSRGPRHRPVPPMTRRAGQAAPSRIRSAPARDQDLLSSSASITMMPLGPRT